MKIAYIGVILAILLLAGCAQTTPPAAIPETTPPAAIPETTPAAAIPPVVEEKPATGEIEILVKGFDPEELTVKKGTTVKWINTAPATKVITVDGKSSGNLASGAIYEQKFDDAGTYNVFDLFGKKWGKVIVTE